LRSGCPGSVDLGHVIFLGESYLEVMMVPEAFDSRGNVFRQRLRDKFLYLVQKKQLAEVRDVLVGSRSVSVVGLPYLVSKYVKTRAQTKLIGPGLTNLGNREDVTKVAASLSRAYSLFASPT
jgi:hypothetical protein